MKRCWPDQFSSYELEGCQLANGSYRGTLIRAPLRERPSDISGRHFGDADIKELLKLIEGEGHLWLLFLRQISELEVIDVQRNKVLLHHRRADKPEHVSILSKNHSDEKERSYCYDVCHNGDVSVALPQRMDGCPQVGRIFSRLPLSDVLSGMPAHLSALFWTSTDRRTLVLDAAKDQGHWASENRSLLQMACECLISLLAKKSGVQRSTLLHFFPTADQPGLAAKLLHELFFRGVAQRCRSLESEQVLYTVAGKPATKLPILLSLHKEVPEALQKLEAPVVVVNEVALQGLLQADGSALLELTPQSLRAWLRKMDPTLHQFCDPEILLYAIGDGARKSQQGLYGEDLDGCPLALTADGSVHCFSAATTWFACCRNEDDWDLARHLPGHRTLKNVMRASQVLLQHPQVREVDFEAVAELGVHASGEAWAGAFWRWYRRRCLHRPEMKLDPAPHLLDQLQVLWHQEADGSIRLHPLHQRHRALSCRDLRAPIVKCLRACHVLIVLDCDCPPVHDPNALAHALCWARKHHGPADFRMSCEDQGWRDLLEALIRSQVPEASEIAKALPLFRNWQKQLVTPSLQLFPLSVSDRFRKAVSTLSFDLLSENDGHIVQFLRKLEVVEMEPEEVARQALAQNKRVEFIAEVLCANLESVLANMPIFPVAQHEELLPIDQCLLWDAEKDFKCLTRRLREDARVFEQHSHKLLALGCRQQLDLMDAIEIAKSAAHSKDSSLSQNLLQRLTQLEYLCTEPSELQEIPWLLSSTSKEGREVLLPPKDVFHVSAKALVGLVRPIACGPAETLKLLGVKMEHDVDDPILLEQLKALTLVAKHRRVQALECQAVYFRLHQAPDFESWIWTEHGFAPLDDVSKDPQATSLSPYMHTLMHDWLEYPIFYEMRERLCVAKLLQLLQKLKLLQGTSAEAELSILGGVWTSVTQFFTGENQEEKQKRNLDVACNILKLLHERIGEIRSKQDLWIPARDGVLRQAGELFVHDMPWTSLHPDGFHLLHRNVPEGWACEQCIFTGCLRVQHRHTHDVQFCRLSLIVIVVMGALCSLCCAARHCPRLWGRTEQPVDAEDVEKGSIRP